MCFFILNNNYLSLLFFKGNIFICMRNEKWIHKDLLKLT